MLRNWRQQLENGDMAWFEACADQVYADIEASLKHEQRTHQRRALQVLVDLKDYFSNYQTDEKWEKLFYEALKVAHRIKAWEIGLSIWEIIESILLKRAQQPTEALDIIQGALQQGYYPGLVRATYKALIALIKDPAREWDMYSLEYAIQLASQLNKLTGVNPTNYAELNLAAAVRCTYLLQPQQANKFSSTAFGLLEQEGDYLTYGKAAITLAVAYRLEGDLEQSELLLNRAGQAFARTDAPHQYTLILHEQAVILFTSKNYEGALQFLAKAEEELQQTPDFKYKWWHQAGIYQTKAMTLIEMGDYEAAIPYLKKAASIWQEHDNLIELANIFNSWGELEFRRGNRDQAKAHWRQAKTILHTPQTPKQHELLSLIEENLARI